jgi:serine/threonine protein kinase
MEHSRIRRLFLWTSGAEPESVEAHRDVVRYSGIGAAVWLTTTISTVSAFIALRLAFAASVVGAAMGATIWALFIFNTDRMLVGGHTEWIDDEGTLHDSTRARVGVWVFRIGLSLLLALSIADPLIVQLFRAEIDSQLPIDKATTQQQFEASQAASPEDQARLDRLLKIYQDAQATTGRAQGEVDKWTKAAQCENQGRIDCGKDIPQGTGVAGTNGDEYRNKQKQVVAAQKALGDAQQAENTAHGDYDTANAQVRDSVRNRLANTPQVGATEGFFARRQALENYIASRPAIGVVRWILVALLVAVDMSAVLLKGLFRDAWHDHLERARVRRKVGRTQRIASEENVANYERTHQGIELGREQSRENYETELWNVRSNAANERKINEARRDADLEMGLRDVARERARRLADDGAPPPEVTTEKRPPAGEPDAERQWIVYNQRWKILGPLHKPARPNSPWIVTDLRGEYSQDLVLKPLSPDRSLHDEEEAKARTRQAANQLSLKRGLVHPNVAEILDAGYDRTNGAYLVHHRYDTDLGEYLAARRHEFRVRDALGFSMQLAEGTCAVWARMQRLHLDLKPSNVGVEDGPVPVLKLMDFGLTARLDGLSPAGNDSYTPRGTHFYAAPEQWTEARMDDPDVARLSMAADLRGLAATIYKMFVGQPPGEAEAAARGFLDTQGNVSRDPHRLDALFQMLETEHPQPMSELVVGLPAGFVSLIAQWLNVDPATRNPGPPLDDPVAYARQVLDSLSYHVNAMLADQNLVDRRIAALRKSAYRHGGPTTNGRIAGGDSSTVDR